jgi:nitroreductase
MPELTLFEAIRTLRAVREFTAEPVSEEMLRTILDLAICAPSGGNDPATRRTSGPKVWAIRRKPASERTHDERWGRSAL